jgi:hypothetical protein
MLALHRSDYLVSDQLNTTLQVFWSAMPSTVTGLAI